MVQIESLVSISLIYAIKQYRTILFIDQQAYKYYGYTFLLACNGLKSVTGIRKSIQIS